MHSSQRTVEKGQGGTCQLMKLACGPVGFTAGEMWEERQVSEKEKVASHNSGTGTPRLSLCLEMV